MNAMTANNGNIVIVKDKETGLLGAVVCPQEAFCSVVFENGEWIHFVESETYPLSETLKTDRTMDELDIVGEAVFLSPVGGPGWRLEDGQRQYIEAALASINLFKAGGNQ